MIALPICLLFVGLAFVAGFLIGQFDILERMEDENENLEDQTANPQS